jgi:glycosyltransferase involved in cell wall biosynthesis
MKIAFLHQPWNLIMPGKPQGSVPIWTSQVARRLSRQHEVYIYSRRFRETPRDETDGDLRYVRVSAPLDPWVTQFVLPVTRLSKPQRPLMSSPLYFRQYFSRAAEDMARKGIDVVHVHSFPQAASLIRSFHPSVKIVVHLHVEWLNLLPLRLAREQIQDADLVLGCSEYVSEKMRRALPDYSARIRTIYNAVDVDLFYEKQRSRSPVAMERKILLVGRISPEKGIHTLLEVFHRLMEEEDNLRLEIIGPDWVAPIEVIVNMSDSDVMSQLRLFYDTTVWGQLRTWLKRRYPRRLSWLRDTTYGGALRAMVQGKMADRVRFVGFIPNEELPRWYREADLLVLPSVYETFGIPLIEAMASGTPVLATRTGGIPEVVEDGRTGVLVEPGSLEELAHGMRRLISDDALLRRMGKEARTRVVEKFSWDKTVSTLMQYYNEVLLIPTGPRANWL